VAGEDAALDAAFGETWRLLKMRVEALLAFPLETMTAAELQRELAAIGRLEGAA
jgi:arsenate reductase